MQGRLQALHDALWSTRGTFSRANDMATGSAESSTAACPPLGSCDLPDGGPQ